MGLQISISAQSRWENEFVKCVLAASEGHEGFEIRGVLIDLACLRDRYAVESDITLTENRM